MRHKVSLLHATYHRQGGPLMVKQAWLDRADQPDQIEYVFAMDEDDEATVRQTDGHLRVISPSGNGAVTAVRNWNAAASKASGDLLMVIADDLLPPQGWDTTLVELVGALDPLATPFAVKLADDSSVENDVLLRHPVVSRAYFTRHGLFAPDYRGLFCDNDLTTRAFWRAAILDGRSLRLEHRHPTLDASEVRSASHQRLNSDLEWAYGRDLYRATWSRRQRFARTRLVRVEGRPATAAQLRIHRWTNCVRETLRYPLRRAASGARLLASPAALRERFARGQHRQGCADATQSRTSKSNRIL